MEHRALEVLKNSSGKWLWEMLRSPSAAGSALLTCGGIFLLYSNSLAVSAFLVVKRGDVVHNHLTAFTGLR